MGVSYRCIGGPLDGDEIEAPPIEYIHQLEERAAEYGVGVPQLVLFIENEYGAYQFDPDRADVLVWTDFAARQAMADREDDSTA